MKFIVCSLRDSASQTWGTPLFFRNEPTAIRSLQMAMRQQPQSEMAQHPDDFELYHIAEYHDDDAQLTPLDPRLIVRCKDINLNNSGN